MYCKYYFTLIIVYRVKHAYMGLRRPPRDFYDHLDGDAVVVILALQFLENNRENCCCSYENSVLEPSGHYMT